MVTGEYEQMVQVSYINLSMKTITVDLSTDVEFALIFEIKYEKTKE